VFFFSSLCLCILRRNLLSMYIKGFISILLSLLSFDMLCNLRANTKVDLVVKGYVFLVNRVWPKRELYIDLIYS
jgi:hypothetical protein